MSESAFNDIVSDDDEKISPDEKIAREKNVAISKARGDLVAIAKAYEKLWQYGDGYHRISTIEGTFLLLERELQIALNRLNGLTEARG